MFKHQAGCFVTYGASEHTYYCLSNWPLSSSQLWPAVLQTWLTSILSVILLHCWRPNGWPRLRCPIWSVVNSWAEWHVLRGNRPPRLGDCVAIILLLFFCLFVCVFYNFIAPVGFLPWQIQVPSPPAVTVRLHNLQCMLFFLAFP